MAYTTENYQAITLSNGLRVVTKKLFSPVHLGTVPFGLTAGMLNVHYGFLFEREGEEGLTHLLEHLLFAGGTPEMTPNELRQTFEGSSGLDQTQFIFLKLSERTKSTLRNLSDMVLHPRFDDSIIENERESLLIEIAEKRAESLREKQLGHFIDLIFGTSIFTRKGYGRPEVIKEASKSQLISLYEEGFYPGNMELTLSGEVSDDILEDMNKYFGGGEFREPRKIIFPAVNPRLDVILRVPAYDLRDEEYPNRSNCEFFFSTVVPNEPSVDIAGLKASISILGSRLEGRLRGGEGANEPALLYGISCSLTELYNVHLVEVSAQTPPANLRAVIDNLFGELNRLQSGFFTQEELDKFNEGQLVQIMAASYPPLGNIAIIERILKKGDSPEKMIESYRSLDTSRLMHASQAYLPSSSESGKYALMVRDPHATDVQLHTSLEQCLDSVQGI